MKRFLFSDKFPYILVGIIVAFDFIAIAFISLITHDFDFSELKSPIFWLTIAVTQIITLVAYFGFVWIGKINAEKNPEMIELKSKVSDNFEKVDTLYLTKDLEDTIEIENLIYKCNDYINDINKKMHNKKLSPGERKELMNKKSNCYQWKLYYESINNPVDESVILEKPNNDFDVEYETVKYKNKIDIASFTNDCEKRNGEKIGSYNEAKTLSEDSIGKILLGVIVTCIFSIIGVSSLKGGVEAIYEVVWRVLMVLLNCYTGYSEGQKLILNYKKMAYNERYKLQNKFFNKMFILNKIARID